MAGVTLGFLKYVLGLDTLSFRKGISQADADMAKMQKSFAAKGKELQSLGKSMSLFVTAPLAALATKGLHEAERLAAAMGQVNAALKSTGGAAGVTSEQLKKAAESFELHSLFESEDVLRDVSARLLAFGSINGDTFTRAQQVIVDFATRTKRDLGDATTVIGKALADPTKAAGALRRAGVVLTQSQQDMIKAMVASGNAAGAQALILGTLETKYRGAAQAAADTDPWHKSHVAFKQLAETVGNAILPLIPPLSAAIASMANAFNTLSPATQKWVIILGAGTAIAGPFLVVAGNLLIVLSRIGPLVSGIATLMKVLSASEALATAASIALDVALSPIILTIGAVALAVGAAYLAWKNWDKIVAIAKAVYAAVKTWLVDKFNAVVASIKDKTAAVTGFFRDMATAVVLNSYVPDMVDAIQTHFGRLGDVMVAPAEKATKAATAAFQKLKDDVSALLDQLFPEIAAAREQLEQLALIDKAIQAHAADEGLLVDARVKVTGGLQPTIGGAQPLDELPSFDNGAFDAMLDKMPKLVAATKDWGAALGEIAKGALSVIGNDINGLLDKSKSLKDLFKDLLGFAIQALTSSDGPFGKLISGARAGGGPVMAGSAYLVGERGPEIFMPSNGGRIVSNSDSRRMAGAGGWGGRGDVTMYVTTPNADSFRRSQGQITRQLRRQMA
jgi:hypothetical protein